MSSLAWIYFQATRSNQQLFDRFILLALLLSCLGDVLLLFVEQQSQGMLFFAAGLGSFLLAHLAYIYTFWIFPPAQKRSFPLLASLCFLILAFGLLFFLWEGIPSALKAPVTVYALAICTMGVAAFGMNKKVGKIAARLLFLGALCFIVSDSLIAINKFKPAISIWQPRIAIMLTYILAQWLIVKGILRARLALDFVRIPTTPDGN